MSVDEQVERAVERIRATWGVCTAVGAVWVLMTYPLWAIIPFILGAIITYFASLYVTGIYLGYKLSGQLDEETEVTPVEDAKPGVEGVTLDLGTVVKTSEAIGRYMDQTMYDWIEVNEESGPVRYEFEHVTPRDAAGNLLLRKEGFACYHGVTYKRLT